MSAAPIRAMISAFAVVILAGCGPLMDRGDFSTAVMNKTDAEVQKALGKPKSIDNSNPDRPVWVYEGATFDVNNNNKRDGKDLVIFSKNASGQLTVTDVKFE